MNNTDHFVIKVENNQFVNHPLTYSNFLSKDECNEIIQQFKNSDKLKIAGVGIDGEIKEDSRKSKTLFMKKFKYWEIIET